MLLNKSLWLIACTISLLNSTPSLFHKSHISETWYPVDNEVAGNARDMKVEKKCRVSYRPNDWRQYTFCIKSKLYDSMNHAEVSVLDTLILEKWIYFNLCIIHICQYNMMNIRMINQMTYKSIKSFTYHY